MTFVAAILDHGSHTVTLVNAGHPSPLIYHRATRSVGEATSLEVADLPIGVLDGFVYASCHVGLEPGDSILAFTDGVTEAMDVQNVQLQTKRVYAAVQGEACSPGALGERVVKVVTQVRLKRQEDQPAPLPPENRPQALPATKTSKTKVIQHQTEGNAKKTPDNGVRYGR